MRLFHLSWQNCGWGLVWMVSSLLFSGHATAQTPLTLLAATPSAPAAMVAVTPPREDHQFWNEFQLIKHVNKKQDVIGIGVLRIGRNWQRPVDERLGVGYAFKLNKYLTLMPTYLHVEYQPYPTRVIHEERLVMNVTGKVALGQFAFTDRNLIERRVRHSAADFTVYRNRLQIDHPMHLGEFKFRGFVADEIWASSQSRTVAQGGGDYGWYRNRISVGISKPLNKHLLGDFFILYQHDGLSRPGNIPVVGTFLRYTL